MQTPSANHHNQSTSNQQPTRVFAARVAVNDQIEMTQPTTNLGSLLANARKITSKWIDQNLITKQQADIYMQQLREHVQQIKQLNHELIKQKRQQIVFEQDTNEKAKRISEQRKRYRKKPLELPSS